MRHRREAEFDNYFANVINLDRQSGFLDMPLQQSLVNKAKGVTVHRDLRAPKPAYSSLDKASRPRPHLCPNSELNRYVASWKEHKDYQKQFSDYFEEQS